ncbi:MAG: sugar-binding protein, partial [Candidatus Omnitrophica bacterium]|nr:sugar-binding protein [Candidatus Omnitrophota bacterium]
MNSEDDFQIGLSPGNFSDIPPEVYIWTPNVRINYKDIVEVKSSKTADGYVIEARIPKEVLFSGLAEIEKEEHKTTSSLPSKFESGLKFGVSVDASDTDDAALPQKLLMSSSKERIWGDPTTFGILELK